MQSQIKPEDVLSEVGGLLEGHVDACLGYSSIWLLLKLLQEVGSIEFACVVYGLV